MNATEQYRHACEVRAIAKMANDATRRFYLEGVAKHRGKDAAQKLREDVWRLMREAA